MPVGGFARNVNRSIVDKIAAYVAARAPDGVEAQELAGVFLSPVSAPPQLCARLIGNVLSGDPRLVLGPDGRWRVNRSGPAAAAGSDYTVIEATEVAAGARHYFIAWAALRVDAAGRAGQTISSAIRPDDPWPPDLVLPPQIRKAVLTGPPLPAAVQQAADFARGSVVVAYRIGGFQSAVARAIAEPGETPQPLSLERLGKRAPGLKTDSREALAARLGLPAREVAGAAATARATAEMLAAMLARKESFGLGEPEGWTELQHPKKIEADFSGFEFDRGFIAGLPESPGIYIMRDANGTALYVGKASNLRARVQRYFRPRIGRDEKTERILEALSRVEIEETGSELAALLAEQRAIRALQPAINIQFDVHDRPEASKGPARRVLLMLSAPDAARGGDLPARRQPRDAPGEAPARRGARAGSGRCSWNSSLDRKSRRASRRPSRSARNCISCGAGSTVTPTGSTPWTWTWPAAWKARWRCWTDTSTNRPIPESVPRVTPVRNSLATLHLTRRN